MEIYILGWNKCCKVLASYVGRCYQLRHVLISADGINTGFARWYSSTAGAVEVVVPLSAAVNILG